VSGGVHKVFEYAGEGIKYLSVPERGTITNMGAELGATTSIFPSDENTLAFLKAQGREKDYTPLSADEDAVYSEIIDIDLDKLEPMIACPHSPDAVVPAREVRGTKLTQVAIGSCTNSSFMDLMKVANILDGKTVHENISLVVSPGSKQVLTMLSKNGALAKIIGAGGRVLESACGPCIGMGQAPNTGGVSLRTFNRNFKGRCGTDTADVYLSSPEIAAMSAIKGYIVSVEDFDKDVDLDIELPDAFLINDNLIVEPAKEGETVEIIRGPNIKPFPKSKPSEDLITGKVLLKVGDGITTDHIMPSNAHLLPYRSNIPYLSEFCFNQVDKDFSANAKKYGGGMIVGGLNYGQGSSREHAALAPLYLGIKAVIAKSFARIHRNNLINNGIMPLTFKNSDDYLTIDAFDELEIQNVLSSMDSGELIVLNKTKNLEYTVNLNISERYIGILKSGGLLNIVGQLAD
ncbi:MAG TPA: aconitate hydratase, partial [Clostridia bacterium]|nr:aconitate hydratase [Clostridia bacterium]